MFLSLPYYNIPFMNVSNPLEVFFTCWETIFLRHLINLRVCGKFGNRKAGINGTSQTTGSFFPDRKPQHIFNQLSKQQNLKHKITEVNLTWNIL